MKFMGYHKHWILPELGCNANTVYHDHAVGNAPEVMPLDTSLFNDLDEAIDRHVVRSSRLAHADPKKFSMSTPARASSAFRRVWTGEPASTRMKQDTGELACNMKQIAHHEGCVAPGLGNSGKRCNNECQKSSNWGGSRFKSKKTEKECWTHDDAKECPQLMIKEALMKVEKKPKIDLKIEIKNDENK